MSGDFRNFIELYGLVSDSHKKDKVTIVRDRKSVLMIISPLLIFCILISLIFIMNRWTSFLSDNLARYYVFSSYGVIWVYGAGLVLVNFVGLIKDLRRNSLSKKFIIDSKYYNKLDDIDVSFLKTEFEINTLREIVSHRRVKTDLQKGSLTFIIAAITIVGALLPGIFQDNKYVYYNLVSIFLMPFWILLYLQSSRLNDCQFVLNRRSSELSRSLQTVKKNPLAILGQFFR